MADLFQQLSVSSQELKTIQQRLEASINALAVHDINDGRLLKGVQLALGANNVPHTLGRPFVGWHLVDILGNANVYRDAASIAPASAILPLITTASVTVDIWVF